MVGLLIVAVLIMIGFLGYNSFLPPETPSVPASQQSRESNPTEKLNPVKAVKTTEKVRDQMQDLTQQQQNRVDQAEKEIN
jgi:Flp pilus assembly protein TadB